MFEALDQRIVFASLAGAPADDVSSLVASDASVSGPVVGVSAGESIAVQASSLATASVSSTVVSDDDLVVHLTLAGNASDSSPHGGDNDGTLQNGAGFVNDEQRGQVLDLDGLDDSLEIPDTEDVNLATVTQRTVAFAFKADDVNGRQMLFGEGGSTRGLSVYIDDGLLYVGGWNVPSVQDGESGWAGTWLTTEVTAGQWHHVSLTLDGGETVQSNALSGYLDGELFGTGEGSQLWEHTGDVGLGRLVEGSIRYEDGNSNSINAFGGQISDFRIYNRTLNADEILTISVRAEYQAESLAELRELGLTVNNSFVSLSPTGGDPHPVTGIVTPGEYWINGDHIADPTNSEPIFMDLSGTGNTYDFAGTTIRLDTRKMDGFGRNLGHGSGIRVIRVTGSNNLVRDITLIGEDIALDTDPNAQRFADWSTVYFTLSGDDNTVDGVDVVTRGSRTDSYGLGDAFGKGASQGIQPFLAHRKASAFRVGEATNAVINDMHLQVNTFGHGFFVQLSTDTTLTNSTVTGELFSSNNVINHPLYQQYGYTYHQNPIPADKFISGAEGGVRMYTGSSGLTVDNVTVTNMRTGFATSLGGGTKTLNNVHAFGTESGFDLGNNTTITNATADGANGPILVG